MPLVKSSRWQEQGDGDIDCTRHGRTTHPCSDCMQERDDKIRVVLTASDYPSMTNVQIVAYEHGATVPDAENLFSSKQRWLTERIV